MTPPLKSAAQRPNYHSISQNGGINEGRKQLVLTRQVTNSGTRRHDCDNTHCHLGEKKHFIYIIQGDMFSFSKLSTAWDFFQRAWEGEGEGKRERERARGGGYGGGGVIRVFSV